jgi:hypothetical protein
LTQLGWGKVADYFRERDMKNGKSALRVPAIVTLQTDQDVAPPALTAFGELMELVDSFSGISQMPQGTSRPESSHMRQGFGTPQ